MAFTEFCYICYMDGFTIFVYIVIGIIYLIYKSNNSDKAKKTGGNKPTPARKPRTASTTSTTSTEASRSQELQDFLKALSKDLDESKGQEQKNYRSLEAESINYDDPSTYPKEVKPQRNFAEVQADQHDHARQVAEERLSAAQKKRLGHAKSVSTLTEEQKKRLEHAKSVAKSKKPQRPKIINDASDIRKAFIMTEIFKRKF